MSWTEIEYYEVTTWAKTAPEELPTRGRALARITFYGSQNCLGSANFFPSGHPTPESRLEHDDEYPEHPLIMLCYAFDMFSPMLNLLQNERPLWLFFNNKNNCGVATGKEAVGEEESDVIRSRDRRRHGL
jgi:hypothetical protein